MSAVGRKNNTPYEVPLIISGADLLKAANEKKQGKQGDLVVTKVNGQHVLTKNDKA